METVGQSQVAREFLKRNANCKLMTIQSLSQPNMGYDRHDVLHYILYPMGFTIIELGCPMYVATKLGFYVLLFLVLVLDNLLELKFVGQLSIFLTLLLFCL